MPDAALLDRLDDGARQTAAGIGLPLLGVGLALLLWFVVGLRRVLDRLSGGDPLAHAAVPATALLGGLMITGVSLDVSSAITAMSGEFTPDADIARVLGTAGGLLGFSGLIGGAVLVAVTTRIAHQARALPTWAVWVSYAVAVLCLSGFWGADIAAVPFWLWVIGAAVGVLRAARRTPSSPAVPAQGAPPPEADPHAPDRHQRLTPRRRPSTARPFSHMGARWRRPRPAECLLLVDVNTATPAWPPVGRYGRFSPDRVVRARARTAVSLAQHATGPLVGAAPRATASASAPTHNGPSDSRIATHARAPLVPRV